MKNLYRRLLGMTIVMTFMVAMAIAPSVQAKGTATCKSLCAAALKSTGGASKLKFSSAATMDFGGLSYSVRKKVTEIQYVCDKKEAYSISVMCTKSTADSKAVLKALKKYIKSNKKSDYLSDYTKAEQKVFKNAICGRKGNYVWYVAMSTKKAVNKKGQKSITKSL